MVVIIGSKRGIWIITTNKNKTKKCTSKVENASLFGILEW
jgi:hypothetical protein